MNYTYEELVEIMRNGDNVECDGHIYIISAVILRGRMIVAREMKEPVLKVELMSIKSNSVIEAPASDIKLILK